MISVESIQLDRRPRRRVSQAVGHKFASVGACLALLLTAPGCGWFGKDKDTTTASKKDSAKDGTRPEDMDPEMSGDVPTTTLPGEEGGGASAGGGGGGQGDVDLEKVGKAEGNAWDNAADVPAPAVPTVKPPGLDLSASEKKSRVSKHLSVARKALRAKPQNPDTAISEAKAALAVDETNVPAMLILGHANYIKGHFDKAEYVLGRAQKASGGSKSPKLHFLFGLVFEATERDDEALRSYQRAVSLDQNYRSAVLNLGAHFIKNKRYSEAQTLYERLTGPLGSKSPAAWTNLGSAYRGRTAEFVSDEPQRRSYISKSESAYKRAITLSKKYANAYYNLGVLYLDADPFPLGGNELDTLKRLQRAKTYFEEYRAMPGADQKMADSQSAVAQKLYDREVRVREKKRQRDERARKKKAKGGGQ